jgi:hypothetical protein
MADHALRPLRKLLAQLLGQIGRIAKILVVDINVLRDDRFDPPADSVGRFTLFDPNRLE